MTFLSPFMGSFHRWIRPQLYRHGSFHGGTRIVIITTPAGRGGQAAAAITGSASGVPSVAAGAVSRAWSSSSMPLAVSTQQPQLEPQPVRIISSGIPAQPASAASRISLSVTPWQRQTYKA